MKPNKAAGVDGLGSTSVQENLKGILEPPSDIIESLMRSSLKNAVVPEDRKRTNVSAVHKKEIEKIQQVIGQ